MRSEAGRKQGRAVLGDVFPKFRISMLDNGRIKKVRIEGAKKLLLCLETEVKISLKEDTLHIYGKELSCGNYMGGAIEVSGRVSALSFENRESLEERG